MDFLTGLPKNYSKILFDEKDHDGYNLLHILSQNEDLTILQHFLTSTLKRTDITLLKKFIQSNRKDGSNFLHILCKESLQSPEFLLKTITWLHSSFNMDMVFQLIKAKTNEGYNVLYVISRYQHAAFFNTTLKLLAEINKTKTRDLFEQKNKSERNISHIMYKHNTGSLLVVLKYIFKLFTQTKLFEVLVCGPNENNDTLCHLIVINNPELFLNILQIIELDQNLLEKIFYEPGSNNVKVIDKLCVDFECFKTTISGINKKYGLDVTRSLLYNGKKKGNPVLLKILDMNDLSEAIFYLEWVLKIFHLHFTFGWVRKRNRKKNLLYMSIESNEKYKELYRWIVENINKSFVGNVTEDQSKVNWMFLHFYNAVMDDTRFLRIFKLVCTKHNKNLVHYFLLHKDNNWTFLHFLSRLNGNIPVFMTNSTKRLTFEWFPMCL